MPDARRPRQVARFYYAENGSEAVTRSAEAEASAAMCGMRAYAARAVPVMYAADSECRTQDHGASAARVTQCSARSIARRMAFDSDEHAPRVTGVTRMRDARCAVRVYAVASSTQQMRLCC